MLLLSGIIEIEVLPNLEIKLLPLRKKPVRAGILIEIDKKTSKKPIGLAYFTILLTGLKM
jgi:hypothetical protein